MTIHLQVGTMLTPADFQVLDEAQFHPLHEVCFSITGVHDCRAILRRVYGFGHTVDKSDLRSANTMPTNGVPT